MHICSVMQQCVYAVHVIGTTGFLGHFNPYWQCSISLLSMQQVLRVIFDKSACELDSRPACIGHTPHRMQVARINK